MTITVMPRRLDRMNGTPPRWRAVVVTAAVVTTAGAAARGSNGDDPTGGARTRVRRSITLNAGLVSGHGLAVPRTATAATGRRGCAKRPAVFRQALAEQPEIGPPGSFRKWASRPVAPDAKGRPQAAPTEG